MNSRIVPGGELDLGQLPKQSGERHEALVDLFGRYIMWMRNWNNESTRRLVESPEAREKLGAIFRKPFDETSQLTAVDREKAIRLAEASVDGFLKLLLQVLSHQGSDFLFGKDHALRLRLVMELVQKENDELVEQEVINRGGQKHFSDYFGKWLNRFRDERTPVDGNKP